MSKPKKSIGRQVSVKQIPGMAWLLGSMALIIGIAVYNLYASMGSVNTGIPQQTTGASGWQKVIQPTAFFFSEIFLQRNQTFVSLPIKYEKDPQITWLSLESTASATPRQWLVTHPGLQNLNWPVISAETVNLYQKTKKYSTMEEFLKNPPAGKLLIEESLKLLPQYKQLNGTVLKESIDVQAVDYILTTYVPLQSRDGVTYYENILDASAGKVNDKKSLIWKITVPTATESNPFYIGNIHIDYR